MSPAMQAALRGLVAQWREDAVRADANARESDPLLAAIPKTVAVIARSSANQLEIVLDGVKS